MLVYTYKFSYNRHIASNNAKLLKGYKAMSNLFKQAHELTRATIQPNDNYHATFTLCLRAIIADAKQANSEPMANQFNTIFEAIGYKPVRHRVYTCKPVSSIYRRLVMDIIYAMTCLAIALFALWCAL